MERGDDVVDSVLLIAAIRLFAFLELIEGDAKEAGDIFDGNFLVLNKLRLLVGRAERLITQAKIQDGNAVGVGRAAVVFLPVPA